MPPPEHHRQVAALVGLRLLHQRVMLLLREQRTRAARELAGRGARAEVDEQALEEHGQRRDREGDQRPGDAQGEDAHVRVDFLEI